MAKRAAKQTSTLFDVTTSSATAQPAPVSNTPAAPSVLTPVRATPDVYVVDAHALIYQVFHALPEMSGPSGQPVGAIHGFIRDMIDLLEKRKPDYLFCAFDYSGDTFRHKLYEKYKEHREEMPIDLRPQIENIRRMLRALGIPILELDQFEADDILATMAQICDERGWNCYVVTNDKDCRQLISDHVKVLNIRKSEVMDAAALLADWGIRPDQVVDFQALVGDSVDAVPGVPLIGPKIAKELIGKYGTLDEVLAHAHEVAGQKRRENLTNFRDQALMSRDLVQLNRQTPIEIDWEAGRVGGVNRQEVAELCREFGFRRLGEQLAGLSVADAPAKWEAEYRTITTMEELAALVDTLQGAQRISIDTETTSAHPRFAEIVGYSFAWQEGMAAYVPVRAPAGDAQLDPAAVRDALMSVLEDKTIEKIGQNLKFDLVVLRGAGIALDGLAFDTMVADYLLEAGERNHDLGELAKRYLNRDKVARDSLTGAGKSLRSMSEVPVPVISAYSAEDADVTLRLATILERRLQEEELTPLFAGIEMPLVEVLAEMEFNGITVDVPRLNELSGQFGERIAGLSSEIYQIAGGEFNIDSRNQLSKILFEDLKLPVIKKTATGPSTDVDVLEELAKRHELPAKIIEYRQFAKLKGTYVDAIPAMVHPVTKRVHTSFKQDVAATGRLSSKDPNLQNIPIRTETGRQIRSAFVAGSPGWKLLTADYSQIELRVLAHFSGDETLRRAFAENQDIHTLVASEVYGVPLVEVTREMRRSAKAINFGIIYGQSPFGLAAALDIEKQQAAEFIEAYFAKYPGVEAFMNETLDHCRTKGVVSTISGRKRTVTGVRSAEQRKKSRQRLLPERIAINTVIQGSAADLIKQAMINVYRRLKREGLAAKLLLQIHDELVLEAPEEELSPLAALVTEEMVAAGSQLSTALVVDVKTGGNWAECEPWE